MYLANQEILGVSTWWQSEWATTLPHWRPNFHSCKSLKWTEIWSGVPMGPETRIECAGRVRQQFIVRVRTLVLLWHSEIISAVQDSQHNSWWNVEWISNDILCMYVLGKFTGVCVFYELYVVRLSRFSNEFISVAYIFSNISKIIFALHYQGCKSWMVSRVIS
jgi:hypothetical protein